jgi:hypothetical protein
MLNTDPACLTEEIGLAEKVRERFHTNTTDRVRRYVGNSCRSDSRTRK